MKILIVQLSDLHCGDQADQFSLKIEKAVSALHSIEECDQIVLIINGDLTNTAAPNEFKAAKRVIGKFISECSDKKSYGFINILVVPGNHDMVLPANSRTGADIESWKSKDEHLPEELNRLKSFYEYANSKNCFKYHELYDVRTLDIGGVKIQFCLLNSAPFSTRKAEDKELHYFPAYVEEKLVRSTDCDLKITIMHHHYEWCVWDTKEMLKRAISTDDITFFGHDHKSEALTITSASGIKNNIIMGGKFALDSNLNSAFNAVVYDTETKKINRYSFDWSIEDKLFTPSDQGFIDRHSALLRPTNNYLKKILKDNQGLSESFTDYYVFPKLAIEGGAFSDDDNIEYLDAEKIFNALKEVKAIRITGENGTGKTALIKFLYAQSVEYGFIPIMVEKRDYDSRIDKMFKDLFEGQYPIITDNSYQAYVQADNSKKIIFVDDIDLIKSPIARENLIKAIIDSGKLLIYTTRERNDNLEETVRNKLQDKEICSLDILLTYKETRDKLVENVGKLLDKSQKDIQLIKQALDYFVQYQAGLFTFTPGNMLQYIKCFMNSEDMSKKSGQTLSAVYETNIRNSIFAHLKQSSANLYLMFLEYMADQMYFELKTEYISIQQLESIVNEYNLKRVTDINAKQFLVDCKEARILKEDDHSFSIGFYEKNIYAYFVAKAINREINRSNEAMKKLMYVMDRICFGINDTIILFLSFIRSNIGIIITIAEKANEMMAEYPEWDFEQRNIPFLHYDTQIPDTLPTPHERKTTHKRIEKIEEERHDVVKFRGIFDYDENDINKRKYIILKALKYTQLVGRALIDHYGALEAEDINLLQKTIYSIPQKIIYATLFPYQENAEKIVQSLVSFAKEHMPDEKIDENRVKEDLAQAGSVLALNIMNDIAYNASNDCTIVALRSYPQNNYNSKVYELMMEENVGNTTEFVNRAISLRKELDDSLFARMLIAQIARKHLIYTSNVDHRDMDRLLSGNVLSAGNKASLLISKGIKSKG